MIRNYYRNNGAEFVRMFPDWKHKASNSCFVSGIIEETQPLIALLDATSPKAVLKSWETGDFL